ncbi:MAG: SDR family oxidoreductase [Candidatus Eisenbacteria bacterium]|nr:SDR family oxidoreductase [Candidatus Eisenbacteria bacterium]
MWSLEGRAAVCLAASKGLGRGIAREMAAAGARTLLVSRNEEHLHAAAGAIDEDLKREGTYPGVADWHRPQTLAADLLEEGAAERIMRHAGEAFGGIDILLNNIGGPPSGTFDELSLDEWRAAYERLFATVVRQIRAALPWLRRSDAPRVVTVTSVSTRQPVDGLILSNTYRPGLVGLAKTLAQEWGSQGILINNLAPGIFDTERVQELNAAVARRRNVPVSEVERERLAGIPLGRLGTPAELGRAAVFLASPANTYITGQTLLVDGGLYRGL